MNTELKAVQTLLERGVKVQIIAPLLFRLFGKYFITLKVYQPGLGSHYRISELYLKAGIDSEKLKEIHPTELLNKHTKTFARVAAIAMLNSWVLGFLFGRLLGWYLHEKLQPAYLHVIATLIEEGGEAFKSTIGLIGNGIVTRPTNLSQQDQGS